jgi:ribonuclease P protein component
VGSSSFTLFGLPSDLDYCRLGLTVPRKVGGAVRRNRVKRLLREVFRHNRTRLEPRMDLVVNARPGIASRSLAELEREFLRSFSILARKKQP